MTEQIIKDAMSNYPEAGGWSNIKCTHWNYDQMEFDFIDTETEKKYKVNLDNLKEGLKKLLKIVKDGKYFNGGRAPNLTSKGYDWDSQDCDALVQCAIFGEVVYG